MRGGRFAIEEAERPDEGSREDLADRLRVIDLYKAIEAMGRSVLPGSPLLEDELRARAQFGLAVAGGCTVVEAMRLARSLHAPARPRQWNCQQEPPYPAHQAALVSLADAAGMTSHAAHALCAEEGPHRMDSCTLWGDWCERCRGERPAEWVLAYEFGDGRGVPPMRRRCAACGGPLGHAAIL